MVELSYIETPEDMREQGWGSKALKVLTMLADQMGVTLVLTSAESADDDDWSMSSADLADWYERNGFEGDRKMFRRPR